MSDFGKPYVKRPVPIRARQWDGTVEDATSIIDAILAHGGTARYHEAEEAVEDEDGKGHPATPAAIYIDTLEGSMAAIALDYVIQGVEGEFYPCKPGIFDKSYTGDES